MPQRLPEENTRQYRLRRRPVGAEASCQDYDRSHERPRFQVPEYPDLSTVMQAITIIQSDLKTAAETVNPRQ
jgi:hypothetical protein